jgi:tripartite-type tricarboxylate transporter receptor subunit TctC
MIYSLLRPTSFCVQIIVFALWVGSTHAQQSQTPKPEALPNYPSKAVRLIIPSAPGGGTDMIARVLAQKVSKTWGQPVIVENKSGGGTRNGTHYVAKQPPDGYTLLLTTTTFSFVPAMFEKLPYDPVNDFSPIILLTNSNSVLAVHPEVPARSVSELITLAKSKPGELRYGSGGIGSVGHLVAELFRTHANIKLLHVPYRGTGPNVNAVVSGETHLIIANLAAIVPSLESGRLRGLAVTSLKRSRVLPNLPTIDKSGLPGYEYSGWYGLWAPARTPQGVVKKINQEFNYALNDPSVHELLGKADIETMGGTPEEFSTHVIADLKKWKKVAQDANIKADPNSKD